ncbi:hypothetical protein TSUD_397930 [Trifolium subterraneum]|uniref:Reverse transcriptase domain-containing protein n=1 Tax=Trifolium subterraneum TaxID=3900 RepID=A0A2Z6P9N4_TRISU|nr:hypothetical protein TSUD_397930 [Trifolium subterraneum]
MTEQIKGKEMELDDILECEEMWWSQRSRALWLEHGDKNTKYLHMKVNIRKTKNTIETIRDSQGQIQHEASKIEQIMVEHFQTLFIKQNTNNTIETVQVIKGRISPDMHKILSEVFTQDEVFQAIMDMKALAAPGPDGLPALFYHNYWDIVGRDITNMVLHVLNDNGDPNHLVPKISHSFPSDFRPISLYMEKAYDRVECDFLEATLYYGIPILITKAQNEHIIHEVKVAPKISHLLFADDGSIFCRASTMEVNAITNIIQTYQEASGQLDFTHANPRPLLKISRNVYFYSSTHARKIHWIKWQKICRQKKNGAMGFRELSAFNEALLAKQGWRILTLPSSLVAQVKELTFRRQMDSAKGELPHLESQTNPH